MLDEIGVEHKTYEHEPVVTIEEEKSVTHHFPGHHTINMFVKNYKGKKGLMYLISLPHDAKWDFKTLGQKMKIGSANLRQANNEKLEAKLGVTCGAVTPLAVCNNSDKDITVVLEKSLLTGTTVNYHPLVQNQTTALSPLGLLKYLNHLGFQPLLISLGGTEAKLEAEVEAYLKQMGAPASQNKKQNASSKASAPAAPAGQSKKNSKKKYPKKSAVAAPQPKKKQEPVWPSPRPQHYNGLNETDAAKLRCLRASIAQKEATQFMIARHR